MDFGALAGGLASGLQNGYRTGLMASEAKRQGQLEERKVGIAEQNAELTRQVHQNELARMQRQDEKTARTEAAWKQALYALAPDAQVDPNLPASEQFGQTLIGSKPDARRWTNAANILLKEGIPQGVEYMNFAHTARQEGAVDMLRSMQSGDLKGAMRSYNAIGNNRLRSISPAQDSQGGQPGKFVFEFDDGTKESYDPKSAFEMLTSPSAYSRYMAEQQKVTQESQKSNAEIAAKQASAYKDATANDTAIEVAKIKAKGEGRAGPGGRATSSSRSGGIGGARFSEDVWKTAEQRQKVLKEVDDVVLGRFGDKDAETGKRSHNENSSRLSTIAQQLFSAATEGRKPLTAADAARLAAEGRAAQSVPGLSDDGRLVMEQIWDVNGVRYPMGAAGKEITPKQAQEYLSSLRQRLKGAKAQDLRSADDVEALASALGMSVDDVIKEILRPDKPAESKPNPAAPAGNGKPAVVPGARGGISTAPSKPSKPPAPTAQPPAEWIERPAQLIQPGGAMRPSGFLSIDPSQRR